MEEQPILDPEVLQKLHGWGGPGLVDQLIDLFLANTPGKVEDVRVGMASGELQRVERACHSLKSSAGNLGASRLHYLAAEMEELAAGSDGARLPELAARLEEAYRGTYRRLEQIKEERTQE